MVLFINIDYKVALLIIILVRNCKKHKKYQKNIAVFTKINKKSHILGENPGAKMQNTKKKKTLKIVLFFTKIDKKDVFLVRILVRKYKKHKNIKKPLRCSLKSVLKKVHF